ncbi:MAG: hypothetical protein J1F11_04515 [Oscillospiraceae bacterium]|nr:hypothetical protein [Oscillospiraceae bacterium]
MTDNTISNNPENNTIDNIDFAKISLSKQIKNLTTIKDNCPDYISTGFTALDRSLGGGLVPGLYVLGAVSSMGKSTFLLQTAENISEKGIPVLYFSMEMAAYNIACLSVSRSAYLLAGKSAPRAGVLMNRSLLEKYTKQDSSGVLGTAIKEFRRRTKNLHVIDRIAVMSSDNTEDSIFFSAEMIHDYVSGFKEKYKRSPVVIVDYLQLLQTRDKSLMTSDKRMVDYNVAQLWKMAYRFETPIIAISSTNRESYKQPSISFSSFKESGGIEFSADILLGLQGRSGGDKENEITIEEIKKQPVRELELVILKNRYGAVGGTVNFDYIPSYGCFRCADDSQPESEDEAAELLREFASAEAVSAEDANESDDYDDFSDAPDT